MTWRTKLADWISGGELTRARNAASLSEARIPGLTWQRDHYSRALSSIARNTCCDGCQEAARVAKEALK